MRHGNRVQFSANESHFPFVRIIITAYIRLRRDHSLSTILINIPSYIFFFFFWFSTRQLPLIIFSTPGDRVKGSFWLYKNMTRAYGYVCTYMNLYFESVEDQQSREGQALPPPYLDSPYFLSWSSNNHFSQTDNISVRKNMLPNGIYYKYIWCTINKHTHTHAYIYM